MKTRLFPLITLVIIINSQIACYDPDEYDTFPKSNPDSILILAIQQDTLLADNFSIIDINALIPLQTDTDKRIVSFETNAGVFIQNNSNAIKVSADLPLDSTITKRIAKVTLKSDNKVQTVKVKASIGGVSKDTIIYFINAFPDLINVETSAFVIDSGYNHEITITSLISKLNGKPSIGNTVKFHVVEVTTNYEYGNEYFRNTQNLSDTDGKTSTIFSAGNSGYKGFLFVIAKAFNGSDSIPDTTTIYKN